MERCPICDSLAHGRFHAKCINCGADKTKYGYVVPERKPFKNFLLDPKFNIKNTNQT